MHHITGRKPVGLPIRQASLVNVGSVRALQIHDREHSLTYAHPRMMERDEPVSIAHPTAVAPTDLEIDVMGEAQLGERPDSFAGRPHMEGNPL